MDCCARNKLYDFDLAILGSGSAAFAAAIKASELDKRTVIIEKGTMGGTCVNFGCIPSKTLIRAAEAKYKIEHTNFSGIKTSNAEVDFNKIIEEKEQLVSELRSSKYQSVLDNNKNITFMSGEAQFVDSHSVRVGGRTITGEKFLISTGSSPFIPNIEGLAESGYLNSREAFELTSLPKDIIVLGGRYIALELAQMFARLGSKVTIVQRSERILPTEDKEIGEWLSNYLRSEGINIIAHSHTEKIERIENGVQVFLTSKNESITLKSEKLIAATGRRANTQSLNLESVGVELNKDGTIKVNKFCKTTCDNIYAAGDVLNSPAFVYVAAYEGNMAAENAFMGDVKEADYSCVPWVIFSDPQVSGVGLNEIQARKLGLDFDVSFLSFDNVPRALTARDTRGFIKLLRKKGTDELIGARVLAPEGSELIMEIALILKYKIPLSEIAEMFHPYLTLSEAVKLAVQTFDKDVKKLSCCAS